MYIFKKIISLILLCLIGVVTFILATEYRPNKIETLDVINRSNQEKAPSTAMSIGIFNIGYGGLDASQDFFMDGGTGTRSKSPEKTKENVEKSIAFMQEKDADVYLLQEVDINSKRTYNINQQVMITDALLGYDFVATPYYKVPYVPVPLKAPYGKVEMNMLTLSRYEMTEGTRYALPIDESIPNKYFYLDRCLMETVIPLDNGKELVVINVHLSAYDEAGKVKEAQLEWIENYIAAADLENKYYVFGGDWNLIMTDTSLDELENQRDYWLEKPEDFKGRGFEWIYDKRVNTVRELDAPYKKGETFERVIDGYLVSPNLEIVSVETADLGFESSDHNPVMLEIEFK